MKQPRSETTRIAKILRRLKKQYPNAKIALRYKTNWELLVAVILSAQCTDKKVNEVTARLFKKYRTLEDYVRAKPKEFEMDIRETGFFRAKTKSILVTARLIKEKFGKTIHFSNVWRFLQKFGLSSQKPQRQAKEQDEKEQEKEDIEKKEQKQSYK